MEMHSQWYISAIYIQTWTCIFNFVILYFQFLSFSDSLKSPTLGGCGAVSANFKDRVTLLF